MKPSFFLKTFLPVLSAIILVAGIAYSVWIEPTAAPPGNNVEAPINVGTSTQYKSGALGVGGLLAAYSGFWLNNNGQDVSGKVLTADANGFGSWQAQAAGGGGGGCYVSYSGGCLAGFTNKGSAGSWGYCAYNDTPATITIHFRPPGGGCHSGWSTGTLGEAFVCCQ
ncbi:MAG: hypothetical protein CO161_03240 [Candidatus Portnoybacteria bacterium CG_4_9_14_3_um_filter_44_9]|uniref:Uncharacterized protein n=1 Tax=Candidatus Portnoybacteria bacterium CG_4_9_14_3_um_filter_44_9 TaxID=1974806 RepID=A0A2M7YJ75_9BACT|nr:MAG: hypothetical protein CO161_03240 [Candidatus Portnoybacteria bacterium CG_4_9_14_3_um_filter_44_9]